MNSLGRVTVTLPTALIHDIDRHDRNRSKFVAEAVRNELHRRRRDELRRSLAQPHPETIEFADQGLADWDRTLPQEDAESLLDPSAGQAVEWTPGVGWAKT
jgi:hypothetical protein